MPHDTLELLNVFEVDDGPKKRFLVCFLDGIRAGKVGIEGRCVVGEVAPDESGEFHPDTFTLNPEFIAAFTDYMNTEAAREPSLATQARTQPGGWLYVVDPRITDDPAHEPPAEDLVGCFAVDGAGQIVPNSFQYNRQHLIFSPAAGVSGMLGDRRFYNWLHPELPGRG
jgi:hypothetical protein